MIILKCWDGENILDCAGGLNIKGTFKREGMGSKSEKSQYHDESRGKNTMWYEAIKRN